VMTYSATRSEWIDRNGKSGVVGYEKHGPA
jgi:hypothetical protein